MAETPRKSSGHTRSGAFRLGPGLVAPDGLTRLTCNRCMAMLEVDPHEYCQLCLGNTCDMSTCARCVNWSDDVRKIF